MLWYSVTDVGAANTHPLHEIEAPGDELFAALDDTQVAESHGSGVHDVEVRRQELLQGLERVAMAKQDHRARLFVQLGQE